MLTRLVVLIVEQNFVSFLSVAAFVMFFIIDRIPSKKACFDFITMVACVFVLTFGDVADTVFTQRGGYYKIRVALQLLELVLRPMIAYFVVRIAARGCTKNVRIMLTLPIVFNFIVCQSAFFGKLVCYFDEAGTLRFGPLLLVPCIVGGFYLISFVVLGYNNSRTNNNSEFMVSVFLSLSYVLSIVFEKVFKIGCLFNSVCMFGVLLYYMSFLISNYNTDQLSGAFLRKRYLLDIRHLNCPGYIICMDINGLKRINDTYGHLEGDYRISEFAETVLDLLPLSASMYRVGGDEFVIIYRNAGMLDTEGLVEMIRRSQAGSGYGAAIGFAEFSGGDDYERAYAAADKAMYEDKTAFWKNHSCENCNPAEG